MQQPRRRHAVRGCCIASCAYGRSGVSPRLCHRGPRICGRSWCCFSFLNKARWGRDGGLGGKGKNSRASSDRRRPQAVPVATREATGIDSRDEGVPFPPRQLSTSCTGRAGPRRLPRRDARIPRRSCLRGHFREAAARVCWQVQAGAARRRMPGRCC